MHTQTAHTQAHLLLKIQTFLMRLLVIRILHYTNWNTCHIHSPGVQGWLDNEGWRHLTHDIETKKPQDHIR